MRTTVILKPPLRRLPLADCFLIIVCLIDWDLRHIDVVEQAVVQSDFSRV